MTSYFGGISGVCVERVGYRQTSASSDPIVYVIKEGRKEIFYLMTHSTHFIFRLYGVGLIKGYLIGGGGGNDMFVPPLLTPHF